MDSNLVFAFLVLFILILIASVIEEAILLAILGFATIALSWNLETIFSITSGSYAGFGQLIILSYWLVVVFAFGKAGIVGYDGYSMLRKKRHV
jgi:hypothetical protein